MGKGKRVERVQLWGTFCVYLAIYQIERDSSLAAASHMLTMTLSQTNFEYLTQTETDIHRNTPIYTWDGVKRAAKTILHCRFMNFKHGKNGEHCQIRDLG